MVNNHQTFYFTCTPHIYAACYKDSVIILDAVRDKYFSLIDDAGKAFVDVLSYAFTSNDHVITPVEPSPRTDDLMGWAQHFLEQNFIVATGSAPTHLASPYEDDGLVEYRWDTKPAWVPLRKASWWGILRAFIMLAGVHRSLRRGNLARLLECLKRATPTELPSSVDVQKLAALVDAASMLYPQKTFCLAWAATFAILALRKNWKVRFVIGVQTTPFYAHAWVETVDGTVINDDPAVAKKLAVLFRTSLK